MFPELCSHDHCLIYIYSTLRIHVILSNSPRAIGSAVLQQLAEIQLFRSRRRF